MNRKIAPVLFALGAVVLIASQAHASPLFRFFEVNVAQVPEIDFRDLGSIGIGTAVMAAGYAVRKAYLKISSRKSN